MAMAPEYLTHPSLPAPHGFFTRRGGVSEGPYASLNASLSGGDDIRRVTQNRALIAGSLGVPPAHLVGVRQVHGTDIATVHRPWSQGSGPDADGLVTAIRGIALGVITADCAPVLLCEAAHGVIGAVHAGWRGAVAGVLEQAIAAMVALGAAPGGIAAVIGPCIGRDSYEVGPDLRDAVLASSPEGAAFFRPGRPPDRFYFDLPGFCAARLAAAGVAKIATISIDTLADSARFFSHRRRCLEGGGTIGHQISAISLGA